MRSAQHAIARVSVDLQRADEAREVAHRLLGLAVGRVEVDDAGRIGSAPGPVVTRIGEELAGLGSSAAWIEHRGGGLVGEELGRGLEALEQALVDGPEQEGRFADPVGERGAVEMDALPGVDLRLAVERQMVGELAHQHMGDGGLRRDAALDQPGGRRRLHHDLFAAAAGVLRPAGDDDAELRRHDVEALGAVLADHVHLASAAGAGLVGDVDDPLDARQVGWQRAAVGAARPGTGLALRRINRILCSEALGFHLLGFLEAQEKLIDRQRLGAPAEAVTLKLLDDLAQPIDLGLARRQHRLQGGGIIRQRRGRLAHEADSSISYNALEEQKAQLAATGTRVSLASCTRRQSSPSSNA